MVALLSILTALFAALLPLFVTWLEGKLTPKPPTKAEVVVLQQQQLKVLVRDAINSKDPTKILTVFAVHDQLLRDTAPSAVAHAISGRQNRIASFADEPDRVHSNGRLANKKDGIRSNFVASTTGVRSTDIATVIAAGRQR